MKTFKNFIIELKTETNPVSVDVYHGSGKNFNHFDQKLAKLKNDYYGGGVGYFTDNHGIAKTYARSSSRDTNTPHVYHTTLKMKNVFDVDHNFTGDKLTHLLPAEHEHEQFARSAGLLPYGADRHEVLSKLRSGNVSLTGTQVFKGLSRGMSDTTKARNHLIKKGYDGLRYNGGMNMQQATQHNVYIPYKNDSITINHVEQQ